MHFQKRVLVSARHSLYAVFALSLLFLGSHTAARQDSNSREKPILLPSPREGTVFQVGEELEYLVSYSFFNIGTIRFKVLDREERNGRIVYKAQTSIDSNPSMSWIADVHIRFYGEMDQRMFSHYWTSDDSTEKGVNYHRLRFDYDKKKMTFDRGKKLTTGERKVEAADTIPISSPCQDGMSLFFYARENVRDKKQESIPTFIENKPVYTFINFANKVEDMDVDAVDYPIATVYLDGKADFVGVAGMTGAFRGWFSNDDARIPIVARMNVWLGSIKAELTKWKRGDWNPPRFEGKN